MKTDTGAMPRRPGRMLARLTRHRGRVLFALAVAAVIGVPVSTHAMTTLSQAYMSKEKLSLGSIVSLEKDSTDSVNAASSENMESILGVVISDGNALLSLSNGSDNQIQVATSGVVKVLVSDVNGEIIQGDQITASPLKGVGMKATSSSKVVGIAQAGLKKENSTLHRYKDKDGQEQEARLGEVPILVNVSYYFKQPEKTLVPSAIQNVANAMAGKPVNAVPIFISLAIFIVTLIIVSSMIYSMIHSSIISVGRNPMSQSAIYRDLLQMSALVTVILAVAMVSIYLVLTRL